MPKIEKSEAQWREQLTPEQFDVTRKHGTERAFTGPHQDEARDGMFKCVCCGNDLFETNAKFDSGTGWPSFFTVIDDAIYSQVFSMAFIFFLAAIIATFTWLLFGKGIKQILQSHTQQRVFNISMAVLLVASMYPVIKEIYLQYLA